MSKISEPAVSYTDMQDKVALVTGAASGIGEACARQFLAQGCRLVLLDRDGDRLAALAAELGAYAISGDVTAEQAVAEAVAACQTRFGGLHYAVNSAGVAGAPAALEDTTLEEWQRVTSINLTGVFLCLKHQLKAMKAAGSGAIVSISSGAGLIGTPGLAPYCASKHAVLGLTKTAAMEVARTVTGQSRPSFFQHYPPVCFSPIDSFSEWERQHEHTDDLCSRKADSPRGQ